MPTKTCSGLRLAIGLPRFDAPPTRAEQQFAAIAELPSPLDRLRECLNLSEEIAPSLPIDVVKWTLPDVTFCRRRLADLEAGRTREGRGGHA